MSSPLRFSDLSPACQTLVRLCQSINHGAIEDLRIEHAEPIFDPSPVILRDVKLDTEDGTRPEIDLSDFDLCGEVRRLICQLHKLGTGIIEHLDVRGGIPRRIVFRGSLTKVRPPVAQTGSPGECASDHLGSQPNGALL
jgi:hypothetical protein